jgi:hypothetical protein
VAALLLISSLAGRVIAAEPRPPRTAVVPSVAARLSSPLGLSGSLALTLGRETESPQFCSHEVDGPTLSLEAGTGGGHVGLGFALLCRNESLVADIGIGLRAAYVRTWWAPWRTEAEQNYVGGMLDLASRGFGLRVGLLKRVGARTVQAPNTLFVFGVSYGF